MIPEIAVNRFFLIRFYARSTSTLCSRVRLSVQSLVGQPFSVPLCVIARLSSNCYHEGFLQQLSRASQIGLPFYETIREGLNLCRLPRLELRGFGDSACRIHYCGKIHFSWTLLVLTLKDLLLSEENATWSGIAQDNQIVLEPAVQT
jgi:hypothetical protein